MATETNSTASAAAATGAPADLSPALRSMGQPWLPFFVQYHQLRRETDAILAFQMGDFFEFYWQDAEVVSEALGIALSRRGCDPDGNPIPCCGIPADGRFPSAGEGAVVFLGRSDDYFARIVAAGHTVAVAVQAGRVDGVMQRGIVATVGPTPMAGRLAAPGCKGGVA